MPAGAVSLVRYQVNQGAMDRLTRSPLGPVGRDIQRRALRVTSRMKQNAAGAGGGPNIRTGTLLSSIAFLRFRTDSEGLLADIGAQGGRTVNRGWNYATLLEGPNSASIPGVHLAGGDFGDAARRPFMARSLEAAK